MLSWIEDYMHWFGCDWRTAEREYAAMNFEDYEAEDYELEDWNEQ